MLIVGGIVLTVVIVFRVAEQPDEYVTWGIFAALVVSGLATMLQAIGIGRFGAGHVLIMGTSGAFIAVCVAALVAAGPATMASLIVVSALFQFLLAYRLSWLRTIFTPTVAGTVIMLIAVTIMPIVFDMAMDVPDDALTAAAPVVSFTALAVIAILILSAPPWLRLWSPVVGIIAGCIAAAAFGIYNVDALADAAWFGIAFGAWPGFDFTPGVEFWALLPAFIVVTLVGALETLGDGVAIQHLSRRRPRTTDYRVVQGAINADGVGNFLSGLMGTLPNTTYSTSLSLTEVTGIAARRVGVVIGAIFVLLAFFPKFGALLITIPNPVAAACLIILLALLFIHGMRIIVQDGLLDRHWISKPVDLPGPAGRQLYRCAAGQRDDFRSRRRGRIDDHI